MSNLMSNPVNKQTDMGQMKKVFREMQTLHAGCSKAEPKIFVPPQTPFPEARNGKMVTTFTYKTSLVRIDTRKIRVIVVTDPQTHAARPLQTHRQDR